MHYRTVTDDVTGRRTTDGAGVRLVRVLGDPTVARFDPFLMLDAFDSRDPQDYIRGFPCTPTGALRPLPTLQPAGSTTRTAWAMPEASGTAAASG